MKSSFVQSMIILSNALTNPTRKEEDRIKVGEQMFREISSTRCSSDDLLDIIDALSTGTKRLIGLKRRQPNYADIVLTDHALVTLVKVLTLIGQKMIFYSCSPKNPADKQYIDSLIIRHGLDDIDTAIYESEVEKDNLSDAELNQQGVKRGLDGVIISLGDLSSGNKFFVNQKSLQSMSGRNFDAPSYMMGKLLLGLARRFADFYKYTPPFD